MRIMATDTPEQAETYRQLWQAAEELAEAWGLNKEQCVEAILQQAKQLIDEEV